MVKSSRISSADGCNPHISAEIEALVERGKERGFVTYDELNAVLPSEEVSSEEIDDVMAILAGFGINIIEIDEAAGPSIMREEETRTSAGNPERRAHRVLGVETGKSTAIRTAKDGTVIMAPAIKPRNFTAREIRDAVRAVKEEERQKQAPSGSA